MGEPAGWEGTRRWHITRRFVYYLVEDFVPPDWAPGMRALDFSGGLGDLGAYLHRAGAASVTVTVPEPGRPRPPGLAEAIAWRSGIGAAHITGAIPARSVDLFCARMVMQFPTWEGDRADPDSMLRDIASVLAPGGRAVLAVHEFFPLHPPSLSHRHDARRLLEDLEGQLQEPAGSPALRDEATRLAGLVELVRFLGLPPREGPFGETGFGLKVPMLVESLVRAGLAIERAEHVEPFTFPLGLQRLLDDPGVDDLADRVFAAKARAFADPSPDTYAKPALARRVLREVRSMLPVVAVPIVRIVGRKPG